MWLFDQPAYLGLLLLLPVAIYFRHFWPRRGSRMPFAIGIWPDRGFSPRPLGLGLLHRGGTLCFWLGVVLLVVGLAGPSRVTRERVFLNQGIDMMIVLDESPSMAAQDFVPVNRFETARDVIERFVLSRENDAIGLVSFGREAALRVPPTLDYEALLTRLAELRIMDLGDGTAIGMGLAIAALHLEQSTADERVIILLTDGENNAGEISPETAARVAAEMGIRIYAIGIGSEEAAPLEFVDPESGRVYRGTFEGGFDEALLQRIAESAGGLYFYAGSGGTLGAIFNAIDSLETVERRVRIQVHRTQRYLWVVFLGLLLILADYLVRRLLIREVV